MSKTLVVGYDGSPEARAALAYAADRANGAAKLYVVTAVAPVPDLLGAPHYQHFIDAAHDRGRELLDEAARRVPGDVALETELVEGRPAEAIVRVAEVRDADEIVIGSRGLSRARAALGSVSHDVLHLADRPVLVVPTRNGAD
jgi:nucleotide-binding universal stress UspA family protein